MNGLWSIWNDTLRRDKGEAGGVGVCERAGTLDGGAGLASLCVLFSDHNCALNKTGDEGTGVWSAMVERTKVLVTHGNGSCACYYGGGKAACCVNRKGVQGREHNRLAMWACLRPGKA